jgi:hypothetical protein
VFWAIVLMSAAGFAAVLTPRFDIDRVRGPIQTALKVAHHSVSTFAAIVTIGALLWASRIGHHPGSVRAKFISDLHGTSFARHAAHYVHGQAEIGSIFLIGALTFGTGFLYSNKILRIVAVIIVILIVWSLIEATA